MGKKTKSPLSSFSFHAPLFQVPVSFSSIFHFHHRTFFLDYSIPVSSFFLPSFGSLSFSSLVLFLFYFSLPGIVVASFCLLFFYIFLFKLFKHLRLSIWEKMINYHMTVIIILIQVLIVTWKLFH